MRVRVAQAFSPAEPDLGHGWHEYTLEAGGVRWHVQRMDAQPQRPDPHPLLLLHGTGASTHSWRALAPMLAPLGGLLAVDLPGHARSGPLPAGRRSLPGMAAATADLLCTLGVTPRAVLGHSAGAAVMLRLALDGGPEGVLGRARLIGLNAALQPFEGWAGWLFPPLARLLALNPLVPWLAARQAQKGNAIRRLIATTGSTLDDAGVAHYARLLSNPRHVAGVLAMTANWDLHALQRDLLLHLRQPLHLLVGQADGTVPPGQAAWLAAQLPTVQLHSLPGLGHLAHEEAPQAVAAALVPILADRDR